MTHEIVEVNRVVTDTVRVDRPAVRRFRWFDDFSAEHSAAAPWKVEQLSLVAGLGGVAAVSISAVLVFVGIGSYLDEWMPRPPAPWVRLLIIGSLCGPTAAGFAMAAFVPLFGARAVTVRFLIAVGLVVPTLLLMIGAMLLSDGFRIRHEHLMEIGLMILIYVLGVGLVAICTQLWTGYSLHSYSAEQRSAQRLSILALLELTALAAAVLAVWKLAAPESTMMVPLLIAIGLGIGSGLLLLPFTIGMMRPAPSRWLVAVGVALACLLAAGWCTAMNVLEFNFQFTIASIGLIVLDGIAIGLVCGVTFLISFWWLRGCGWTADR